MFTIALFIYDINQNKLLQKTRLTNLILPLDQVGIEKTLRIIKPTFPGMKQHKFISMNFIKVIPRSDSLVSTAVSISQCLAKGCFRRSDSLRGSWDLTWRRHWAWYRSTLWKPRFNTRLETAFILLQTCKIKDIG